ncbi:kinase-like domain-containing protein [Rhodofomes roseus]|uniref:Kinase-like domain-containing protein n=1 Tax=Rhodofomes roseus TaxID=34475 RepID=A0ABQ8K1F1_9APHY|nr:kinase-like domain-containing protein [Rhodofomes roseus]KAH9830527.1 kinase-like domain-containing protein [Rhodofomes roseus]
MSLSGSMGRPKSDYAPSEIDRLSEREVIALLRNAKQYTVPGAVGVDHILRVTDTLVAKYCHDIEENVTEPSEALTLDLVFRYTTIPVPRVRRIISLETNGAKYILMDRIPGRQLSSVWQEMSLQERLRIVFTLHDYVRQLQAIRHPRSAIPGPLAPGNEARECTSPVWGRLIEERGPFSSYNDFSAWFDQAQRVAIDALKNWQIPANLRSTSFKQIMGSSPLVLCHQDLHMRNIIFGDDGRLWVIDWGDAGFYPPWFEYLSMKLQSENEETVMHRKEHFWDLMIPFICGPYFQEERWLALVSAAFSYKFERVGRR